MTDNNQDAGTIHSSETHSAKRQGPAPSEKAKMAGYIEEMLREMETLAVKHRIDPLRDLLRLAKEEARRAMQSA